MEEPSNRWSVKLFVIDCNCQWEPNITILSNSQSSFCSTLQNDALCYVVIKSDAIATIEK